MILRRPTQYFVDKSGFGWVVSDLLVNVYYNPWRSLAIHPDSAGFPCS